MCTMIATSVRISGSARTGERWSAVDEARLGYDHATRIWAEHALRVDIGRSDAPAEGIAVELDLTSARALLRELADVIAAAERSGAG